MEFEIGWYLAVIVAGIVYFAVLGIANRKRAKEER